MSAELQKCFVEAISYLEIKDYRASSVDLDEAAHYVTRGLIRVYSVCKSLALTRYSVKRYTTGPCCSVIQIPLIFNRNHLEMNSSMVQAHLDP